METVSVQMTAPSDVDQDFVVRCLSEGIEMGNLIISIFDYGGQSIFNAIHHFFLTRYGVYCLVFNMEWLIGDSIEIRERCISYLCFWVNSIVF